VTTSSGNRGAKSHHGRATTEDAFRVDRKRSMGLTFAFLRVCTTRRAGPGQYRNHNAASTGCARGVCAVAATPTYGRRRAGDVDTSVKLWAIGYGDTSSAQASRAAPVIEWCPLENAFQPPPAGYRAGICRASCPGGFGQADCRARDLAQSDWPVGLAKSDLPSRIWPSRIWSEPDLAKSDMAEPDLAEPIAAVAGRRIEGSSACSF